MGLRDNALVFGDFENEHLTYLSNINSYWYSPQADINEEETHAVCVEESLVLITDVGGSANHYQWFKDGTPIAGAPDSATYLIQNATLTDAGIYHCEVTSDIVSGLTLTRRPIDVTITTLLEDTHNTVTSRSYDITGSQIGAGKQFFDGLGLLEQTQTWNIRTDETWASQVLRDVFDRTALQTLSAPITTGSEFTYKEDFVMRTTSVAYALSDYQNPLNPSSVVSPSNTLGWYYSENNTQNPYQDQTEYPFSRTIYSILNPGRVLTAIGGNKINRNGTEEWSKTYSFTMPSGGALAHSSAFGDTAYNNNGNKRVIKTVTRDVHGIETVVFSDSDGLVLGAARSGNEENPTLPQYQISLEVGSQGYVDIHIPQGCTGITLSGGGPLDGASYQIYDLVTENTVTSPATLPAGFYRVAFTVKEPENPYVVSHQVNYYDYSLNEYDTAQRLVASYQPLGAIKVDKPVTTYEYNTLGQLIKTSSPDEGIAEFKYREDGQIRYSRNSKQLATGEFSYTNYDPFGRPVESGVVVSTAFTTIDPDDNGTNTPAGTKKEQQFTTYDIADNEAMAAALDNRANDYPAQSFVAGNVAHTANDISQTWYAYDIYGRVKWLVQDINGLGVKTIDYNYHPVNGLVEEVVYQKAQGDQFIHRYSYDAAYQLTLVETATNSGSFTEQARYSYYNDGSLKRTELAEGAQGMDYVYNLAGQLKSINHPTLNPTNDPGGDTNDMFGMALDYHNNDYLRTNTPTPVTTYPGGIDQLNGNIKSIRWSNANPNTVESQYAYTYDRNNWLTGADFDPGNQNTGGGLQQNLPLTGTITNNQAATNSITVSPEATISDGVTLSINPNGGSPGADDYDVSNISYDANGNIQSLVRKKGSQDGNNAMDNLGYVYKTDKPNQLLRVNDGDGDVANADDIGNHTEVENYVYNSIGQLIENKEENLEYIYNTSGLVTEVKKNSNSAVKFYYNDRNHRVRKETFDDQNNPLSNTYYVRDVAGQVLAIYSDATGNVVLAEQPVYGSGRIGVAYNGTNNAKQYVYELTDHLGNVRATFAKNGSTAQGEGYTDYYPFGMPMPGRQMTGAEQYRYGYQGQEKDPETGKEAFELRLWDSRIGRWLTTDPYGQYNSPYLGMGNNPMNGIDPDGGFWEEFFNWIGGNGWNSNAALEYQANGGTLGEWTGNKFSGYRNAATTIDGETYGTTFNAVNDFINYDAFGLDGKIALGFARAIGGDVMGGHIGGGGGGLNLSVTFLGGKYGNYWYDYYGWEAGQNYGAGIGFSGDYALEGFISVYIGNNSNPDPSSFEGPFGAFELNGSAEAGVGGGLQGSVAYGGGWITVGLGANVGAGAKISVSGEVRYGETYLITPIKETNQRTIKDYLINKLVHVSPVIPSFQ
ncbi:RHS repeat-associated core domain-containing protein [uncultured Croceitalea sp.]|uniref:RHS repeat-associated core domain-containing protein n=1 Tax=uncultured Croceitalea sp. TaxID=1798908 RepID=UPI00374F033F